MAFLIITPQRGHSDEGGICLRAASRTPCTKAVLLPHKKDKSILRKPICTCKFIIIFVIMQIRRYYCYILTNPTKTVLYTGITNNLGQRLIEHYLNRGKQSTFAGRYNCYNLIYFEVFNSPEDAIHREKEIKGW